MSKDIKELAYDIYIKVEGYISAQVMICLFLGAFYSVCFSILGLPQSIIFGFFLGFLNIIPYIGLVGGFVISVIWGVFYLSGWGAFALLGVFLAGQILENYYLTPKLVSNKTGLHPLVVFLSIVLGGALFGVLGMVLAVPIAIIAVALLRFYKVRKQQRIKND